MKKSHSILVTLSLFSAPAFAQGSYPELQAICADWQARFGQPTLSYSFVDPYQRSASGQITLSGDYCVTDLTRATFSVKRINGAVSSTFTVRLSAASAMDPWTVFGMDSNCVELTNPGQIAVFESKMAVSDQFRQAIQDSVAKSVCPAQEAAVRAEVLAKLNL